MSERIRLEDTWDIPRLFQALERGGVQIPRFQRDYVWERSKVVKLLNSIYKEYPIGTFFLWEAKGDANSLCRDLKELGLPGASPDQTFSVILDGQQRITSLYVALKGKVVGSFDYSKICFNLENETFHIPKLNMSEADVPAFKVYDADYSMMLMEQFASSHPIYMRRIRKCNQILQHYPLSIIWSMGMGLEEVVEIFERINQGGKRLSMFDLVHASVWSDDFDLRKRIEEFNDGYDALVFGDLDDEIFTQSLSLNIAEDCTKQRQLKLTSKECADAWEGTVGSLKLARDFVRNNLGVQRKESLPYNSLLAIIQHYFYVSKQKAMPPDVRSRVTDWFWTVVFSSRYSSSTLSRMNEDAIWVRQLAKNKITPRLCNVKLDVEGLKKVRMNQRSVIKNGILCIFALNKPVDFDTGEAVTLDKTNASRSNSKENHHFFPYSLHRQLNITKDRINSVLNFAFITSRLNGEILNKRPSVYLSGYEATTPKMGEFLGSHYIDSEACAAAKADDYEKFLNARGKAILAKINELCRVDSTEAKVSNLESDDDDLEQEREG